ncbi:MAG: hypothetical protein WEC75_12445 [Dehalococcoidia bacterium]
MAAALSRAGQVSNSMSHERRLAVLGVLIVACMVSTTAHYTHNYLEIEHYPPSGLFSNSTIKLAIVVAWPALTAIGILGYWLYASRRYAASYPLLAVYSLLGIATLGHFTEGSPHIPPFWYATIFTDALLGFAILAFAHWSAVMAAGRDRRG